MEVKRRCAVCPPWTQTVCRHVWNKWWNARSHDGEGCIQPMDDVAEAWRKAGWTPAPRQPLPSLPKRTVKQGELKLTSLVERYRKGIRK